MSQVQASLGDKQAALDSLRQALILWQGRGDPREARTLQRFGELYASVGESQLAFDYFDRALEVFRKTSDPFLEGQALHSLGRLHALLGQHQQAMERLNQALGLRRQIGDLRGQAYTLTYLGAVYSSMGEKQQAENAYRQALPIWQTVGDRYGEAYTLTYLGALYDSLGERSKALELLEQALPLRRAAHDPEGEANTLYHLASIKRDQGNLDEARERIEASLNLIERVRDNLASQPLRASYFATVQDYYQFYLDLLMRLHARRPAEGFDAVALQVSERARARTLNEMLVKARLATRSGVDPQLVERERSLQQRLDAKAKEHEILLRLGRQRAALHKEIGSLITELQEVEAQIRAASPYFAPPEQPAPLRLEELQQLLDSNTLLLEYALGAERSHLWAVTPTALASHELPKRARVEAAARRFYELLTTRNRSVKRETSAQKRQRIIQADKQASTAAAALSRMLLTPVATQLGRKRLLIVADGALQYVPFAALPVPATEPVGTGRRGDRETRRSVSSRPVAPSPRRRVPSAPLIVDHEIINLPSASTLAVLRRDLANRQPASKTIAVLADPVFSPDDERVPAAKGTSAKKSGAPSPNATGETLREVEKALEDLGESDVRRALPRLYKTRDEAAGIAALVSASDQLQALDFAANRAAATSAELGQYRILHFATHSLITNDPERSGIVLSLVDERGRPQDGYLRAQDIYNLKLPAELVVLSACRTGLGKEIKGEGMINLTRGFMYAGAPRVVVSLWSLPDKATAELMQRFYQKMLGPERLSPAAALHAAQVEMWKSKQWPSAYHWAGFVLQGECR